MRARELEGDQLCALFNEPLRDIADRWSVSKTDLMRHRNRHLPVSLIGAKEVEEEARTDNLLNSARYVEAFFTQILTL